MATIEAAARRATADLNQPSQHTMLLRRLKLYKLHAPCPVADDVAIVECPSCFARMILQCSRDYGGPSRTSGSCRWDIRRRRGHLSEWLDVDPLFDYICNCFLSYEAVGEQMNRWNGRDGNVGDGGLDGGRRRCGLGQRGQRWRG